MKALLLAVSLIAVPAGAAELPPADTFSETRSECIDGLDHYGVKVADADRLKACDAVSGMEGRAEGQGFCWLGSEWVRCVEPATEAAD